MGQVLAVGILFSELIHFFIRYRMEAVLCRKDIERTFYFSLVSIFFSVFFFISGFFFFFFCLSLAWINVLTCRNMTYKMFYRHMPFWGCHCIFIRKHLSISLFPIFIVLSGLWPFDKRIVCLMWGIEHFVFYANDSFPCSINKIFEIQFP